jgi:hypothetical protein
MSLSKCALVLTAVVLSSSCGRPSPSGTADAPEPPSPAASAPVVEAAPDATALAPTDAVVPDVAELACSPGTGTTPIDQRARLSAAALRLTDGTALVVTDLDAGRTSVHGCMSNDTADVSADKDLSLAAVVPVHGGVIVAIAAPTGRSLVDVPGLEPISIDGTAAPFDREAVDERFAVHLYVSTGERITNPNPEIPSSVAQLQGLVRQAAEDGTASVTGLAPDLLTTN